jgi:hypothetical protein
MTSINIEAWNAAFEAGREAAAATIARAREAEAELVGGAEDVLSDALEDLAARRPTPWIAGFAQGFAGAIVA